MRPLLWLLRVLVLLLFFGLAVKNSGPVELRLYFDSVWQAPLALLALACFAAGAALGASAALIARIRQGREIRELKRRLAERPLAAGAGGE